MCATQLRLSEHRCAVGEQERRCAQILDRHRDGACLRAANRDDRARDRGDARDRAEPPLDEVDCMASEVCEGTATGRRSVELPPHRPVHIAEPARVVADRDLVDLAQPAVLEHRSQRNAGRQIPPRKRRRRAAIERSRARCHLGRLSGVKPKRLLADDLCACVESRDRHRMVEVVGRRDDDDVRLFGFEHRVEVGVCGPAGSRGYLGGALPRPCADPDKLRAALVVKGAGVASREPPTRDAHSSQTGRATGAGRGVERTRPATSHRRRALASRSSSGIALAARVRAGRG